MAIGRELLEESKTIEDIQQWPFRSVAAALEVIPRTLVENCGGSTIRLLTALRAKHAEGKGANCNWGIDGNIGEITDMKALKVLDPFLVKTQTIKTAIEAATMLLRIDDIVSGMAPTSAGGGGQSMAADDQDDETVSSLLFLKIALSFFFYQCVSSFLSSAMPVTVNVRSDLCRFLHPPLITALQKKEQRWPWPNKRGSRHYHQTS